MSDDNKLVKVGVNIETAESFAKAIGRAIDENDVATAKALSGELRAKLTPAELLCRRCGHRYDRHEITPGSTSGCDNYMVVGGNWCGCSKFVFPEGTVGSELANTTNVKPDARRRFVEGKHLARLRSVFYERAMNGRACLIFQLDILKSRTMPLGEITYLMALDRSVQVSLAKSQLDRLGIDPQAIDGTLDNINLNVMVVAAEKLTKKGVKIMSVNLRPLDDTDFDFFNDFFND